MVTTAALVYIGAVTILFFFWIYGIVSFILDIKNKIIPGAKQYLRGRRQQKKQERKKQEQEELKEGLL